MGEKDSKIGRFVEMQQIAETVVVGDQVMGFII